MRRRKKLRLPAALSVVFLSGTACDSGEPRDASLRDAVVADAGTSADAAEEEDAALPDAGQMDAEADDGPVV